MSINYDNNFLPPNYNTPSITIHLNIPHPPHFKRVFLSMMSKALHEKTGRQKEHTSVPYSMTCGGDFPRQRRQIYKQKHWHTVTVLSRNVPTLARKPLKKPFKYNIYFLVSDFEGYLQGYRMSDYVLCRSGGIGVFFCTYSFFLSNWHGSCSQTTPNLKAVTCQFGANRRPTLMRVTQQEKQKTTAQPKGKSIRIK